MEQKKYSISFKENKEELKLYDWIMKKSKIIGPSNATKQILYDEMLKEEKSDKE